MICILVNQSCNICIFIFNKKLSIVTIFVSLTIVNIVDSNVGNIFRYWLIDKFGQCKHLLGIISRGCWMVG